MRVNPSWIPFLTVLALGCSSSSGGDGEDGGADGSTDADGSERPTSGSASLSASVDDTGGSSEGSAADTSTSDVTTDGSTGGSSDDGSTGNPEPFALEPGASTYLGGNQYERIQGVHVDDAGNIFVGGTTHSSGFPATAGAFDTSKEGPDGGNLDLSDGFVAKLSPDGSSVEWATFIGGSARESVYGVRTDAAGNVYAIGSTGSSDFPTTPGAYDPTFNGPVVGSGLTESFVVGLSPDGSTLLFGTYLGGAAGNEENPRGSIQIAEATQRIYVSGQTSSTNFPATAGAFQTNYGGGGQDAFVAALSLDGSTLIAASYLGGGGSDTAYSKVSLHRDGSVYVTGSTTSGDFPTTPGAYQTAIASGQPNQPWWQGGDAFVTRMTADLDDLVFSTYLGGTGNDSVGHNQGASIDSQGRAVVVGSTDSDDFPASAGAFATSRAGMTDGFVAIVSEDGTALDHATYIGGIGNESLSTMFVDDDDRVYVTGTIASSDWPTTDDAYQPMFGNANVPGGSDAVLTIFTPTLSELDYSTYLGGSGPGGEAERGRSIWVTDTAVYVSGATDSTDFPIVAPSAQAMSGGGVDGFVFRFDRL